MVSRFRKSARTTASPTATSPAATAMVKTAKTWPTRLFSERLKAMKLTLAAFIISSIDMRMMMAFRRVRTPSIPMEKRIRLKISTWWIGTGMRRLSSGLLPRQDDRPDHRHQEQDRGDLERQQVVAVQARAHGLEVPSLPQDRGAGPLHVHPAALVDVQDEGHDREPDRPRHGGVQPHAGPESVAQVHQHDHEQEQHHDPAGVDQHLHRRHELRLEQHVDAGDREEAQDQVDGGMHRVAAPDHHRPRDQRDRRQDVEDRRGDRHAYSLYGSGSTPCSSVLSGATNPSLLKSAI